MMNFSPRNSLVVLLYRRTQCLFSQDYETNDKFTIEDESISHMLPSGHQDMIVRVYSKKPELVSERILNIYSVFIMNLFCLIVHLLISVLII